MSRLDQFGLIDDTRIGFVFVLVFIFLDTWYSLAAAGWNIILFLGEKPAHRDVGLLQIVMLVAIATACSTVRVMRHKLTRLAPAATADPLLGALADRIAMRVLQRPLRFYVSANILDLNAFCALSFRAPYVVLGGGMRREVRKRTDNVAAVLAHECAHVGAHDTLFLLTTWYFFLAYVGLAFLQLIFSQVLLWSPEWLVISGRTGKFGTLDFLAARADMIFNSGFASFVSIYGLSIALIHFIKQREYRADEAASQFGFRSALTSVLSSSALRPRPASLLRVLARFHPSAEERLDRLLYERAWAKLDWLFVASMAFAIMRIRSRLPTPEFFSIPEIEGAAPVRALDVIFEAILDSPELLQGVVSIFLLVAFVLVLTLHAYRVTATQYKLGVSFARRLAVAHGVITAIVAGTFVGSITTPFTLRRITDHTYLPLEYQMTLSAALDDALHSSLVFIPALLFTLALVILTPIAMRLPRPSRLLGVPVLLASTLLVSLLLQVMFNVLMLSWLTFFPQQVGGLTIDALPQLSSRIVPGLPSPLETAILAVCLYVLMVLAASVGTYVQQRITLPRGPAVHPSRLAQDADSLVNGG
jgi:Zn-dependent protease with chaperone function